MFEKRRKLIEEIKYYQEKNLRLEKEIEVINREEERMVEKQATKMSQSFMYWRMPLRFFDTVFYTRKKEIMENNTYCFSRHFHVNFTVPDYIPKMHMAMLCLNCNATPSGVVLTLQDPYATVVTTPINIPYEEAREYIGYILYLVAENPYMEAENSYRQLKVIRIKKTSMTLKGIDDVKDEVKDDLLSFALQYKDVSNEDDAIEAINMIQNFAKLYPNRYRVNRIAPTEVRVLFEAELPEYAKKILQYPDTLYGFRFFDGTMYLTLDTERKDYDGKRKRIKGMSEEEREKEEREFVEMMPDDMKWRRIHLYDDLFRYDILNYDDEDFHEKDYEKSFSY